MDFKVKVGYFSSSRKSALWRWPSRISLPVEMLAACTVASTLEDSIESPMVMVPSNSLKWPRTFEATRCRATKSTLECTGSMT